MKTISFFGLEIECVMGKGMSKRNFSFVLCMFAVSVTAQAETCEIGDYESRWHHRLEHKLGTETIPSMLDDCAMMDRINESVGSLTRRVFELIVPQPGDMDFFCGFGSDDVFHEVTRQTDLAETETVNAYVTNIGKSIEEFVEHGDIPIPGTDKSVKASKAYERIFSN